MKGGKFLSSGSYACGHTPPIRCEGDKDRKKPYYKNSVGKIFERASDAEEEYNLHNVLNFIDPEQLWTLSLKKKCMVTKFNKQDEPEKCEHLSNDIVAYTQLIFKNGGTDLSELKSKYWKLSKESKRNKFIKIFISLGPVFKGVANANKMGYHHLDIKPANLLFNEKQVFVIDFGLMRKGDNIFTSKAIHMLEFNYPYYPPEFKLYAKVLLGKFPTLQQFKTSVYKNGHHLHCDPFVLKDIDEQLDRFYNLISSNDKKEIERKLIILKDKIDLYSLGVTVLELYKHLVHEDNSSTLLIKNLLQRMINQNPFERIDWEYLLKEHSVICKAIGKFSRISPENKKN